MFSEVSKQTFSKRVDKSFFDVKRLGLKIDESFMKIDNNKNALFAVQSKLSFVKSSSCVEIDVKIKKQCED